MSKPTPPVPEEPEVLCFGCLRIPGHYLYSKRRVNLDVRKETPWGNEIDGTLCSVNEGNDIVLEHHKNGWTAIAFWDRSGDSRPGSNTVFVVQEEMPAVRLVEMAKRQWPDLFKRSGFPLSGHYVIRCITA